MVDRLRTRLLEVAAGVGILLAWLALKSGALGPWTLVVVGFGAIVAAIGVVGTIWELLRLLLGRHDPNPGGGIHVHAAAGSHVTINQAQPIASLPTTSSATATNYAKAKFVSERVFMRALELTGEFFLTDRVFERCEVIGPAILLPVREFKFLHCTWGGTPEALVWTIPDPRSVVGVIGLERCEFHECTFKFVALAAAQRDVKRWQGALRGKDWSGQ